MWRGLTGAFPVLDCCMHSAGSLARAAGIRLVLLSLFLGLVLAPIVRGEDHRLVDVPPSLGPGLRRLRGHDAQEERSSQHKRCDNIAVSSRVASGAMGRRRTVELGNAK